MTKTIAFVPVRGGSKSIPGKNIKKFCGKPLIYWVINELNQSELIDEIVIATDSEDIKKTVSEFFFKKVIVYNRDEKNASDFASTESVMLEYIKYRNLSGDDIFMLVQVTSPFTQKYHFEEGLKQFFVANKDSLLSCARVKRFFWNEDGKSLNYDYNNRPRRQNFQGQLIENGAFYINTVGNIRKYNNRLCGEISIYEMPEYTSVEIDEEEDWIIAEKLMYKYIIKKKAFNNIKLFLTDVDGVLTDAGMYYSEKGDELKKFNTKDGKGFELLRNRGIITGIITSENTEIVKRRAEKLKVDYLFQGVSNKLKVVKTLCKELNIPIKNVAYIGDDLNDIEVLNEVGVSASPSSASFYIRKITTFVTEKNGGEGAVREFIEKILFNNKVDILE